MLWKQELKNWKTKKYSMTVKSKEDIFENNRLLNTTLARVLSELDLTTNGAIFVNVSYSENSKEASPYSGLSFVKKRRSAGDATIVILYGFDDKKHLAKKEDGSILKSEGVFYLQMPFDLSKQLRTLKKALGYDRPITKPLDNTTVKSEIFRILRLLNHNLPNVIGTIEPNINCLMNASAQQVYSEWSIIKEAILGAKRNRIEKERAIFQDLEKLLLPYQNNTYDEIWQQLSKANTYYKDMFDILTAPNAYTELKKKSVIEKGRKTVEAIKNARMALDRTINETSSR